MSYAQFTPFLYLCFSRSFSCPFITQLEWYLLYSASSSFVFIFSFILKGSGTSSPRLTASLSLILSTHFFNSLLRISLSLPKLLKKLGVETYENGSRSIPAHSAQFTHEKHAISAIVNLSPTIHGPSPLPIPASPPAVDALVPAAVLFAPFCSASLSSRTLYRRLVYLLLEGPKKEWLRVQYFSLISPDSIFDFLGCVAEEMIRLTLHRPESALHPGHPFHYFPVPASLSNPVLGNQG